MLTPTTIRRKLITASAATLIAASTTLTLTTSSVHAAGLATDSPSYDFVCDGGPSRSLGTLSGAQPGETVTFASPEVGGLLPGVANGNGEIGLIWQCDPVDVGTVWHVDATGTSSGRTGSFIVNGVAAGGGGGTTPPPQAPRPTGTVTLASDFGPKLSPQPYNGSIPLKPKMAILLADFKRKILTPCLAFSRSAQCYRAGVHYLDRTGTDFPVSMADAMSNTGINGFGQQLTLLLNLEIGNFLPELQAVPAGGSKVIPFDTGWQPYRSDIANFDWAFTIHSFSYRVMGDLWIGPADSSGRRELQIRYRGQMYDVYDYPTCCLFAYKALAVQGRASEFYVKGNTNTQTVVLTAPPAGTTLADLPFHP